MNFIIIHHLTSLNLFAVFIAAIIYFFLGSLWFSILFGRIWTQELEKQNIFIKEPTTANLMLKMGLTFLGNLIAALGMALLVQATNSATLFSGLELGFLVAICFVATAMGISYIWPGRSMRLSLIDIGYPVTGIIISATILSLWR